DRDHRRWGTARAVPRRGADPGAQGSLQALRRRAGTPRSRLRRDARRGDSARRRQRRRQVRDDQVHRRHLSDRQRRDPLAGKARRDPRPEGLRGAGDRDRLPGPRARRQPRRRAEHVPRARGDHPLPRARRDEDGAPLQGDAQLAVCDDDPLGAPDGGGPVGRSAPVDRRRQGRHVELAPGDPRRADRGARRRADAAGARPRQAPCRPGARGHARVAQPARHLRGRRPHHGPAPGPGRRALQHQGDQPARGRRGHHGGQAVDGSRCRGGARPM
ncbi:MAG: D-xylose transport ATP-binding protein XylG, partial [uncultured Solirubrobacteraceae bacterium]